MADDGQQSSGDEPGLTGHPITPSGREPSLGTEAGLAAAVDQALRQAGQETTAGQRGQFKTLKQFGRAALPLLVSYLAEEDPGIRRAAALGLGSIGGPDAVPHLIILLGDPNVMVVRAATNALVLTGAPAVPALIAELKNESDTVRREVCVILKHLRDPRTVSALITVVESDKSIMVRAAAARALGRLGDKRAVQPLISALSQLPMGERYVTLKRSLLAALAQFATPEVTAFYTRLLKDRFGETRIDGLMGLSQVEGERAAQLIASLLEDPQTHVRRTAVDILQDIGDLGQVPDLEKLLDDPAPHVRAAAEHALRQIRKRSGDTSSS